MENLNGHEAGNGGYSQGDTCRRRWSLAYSARAKQGLGEENSNILVILGQSPSRSGSDNDFGQPLPQPL
jgi:hypothetical protein